MQNVLRRALRALVASLGLAIATTANASTVTTNYSDLWWMPAESGWGVNVAQQADFMYATFYVFGVNNQPIWYTALLTFQGVQADGSALFDGDLYQTTGPYFGGAFNAAPVATVPVGTAMFQATTAATATLTYRVGAVVQIKTIERYTLRNDTLAGSYIGALSDVTSNCQVPSNNGFRSEESGVFTLTQVGNSVTLHSPSCTYTGNFHQDGQIARVDGNYTCNTGALGTISFFGLRAEVDGVTGRYTGHGSNCDFNGNIALARRK
jgi:hypothetical protein